MTHLSRKKLDKSTEVLFEDALLEVLKQNSSDELVKILPSLLTETEIKMISKRLIIFYLLSKDHKVDDITKATNTTRQTVSRLSDKLKLMTKDQKSALFTKLKRFERKHLKKKILKTIMEAEVPYTSYRKIARSLRDMRE